MGSRGGIPGGGHWDPHVGAIGPGRPMVPAGPMGPWGLVGPSEGPMAGPLRTHAPPWGIHGRALGDLCAPICGDPWGGSWALGRKGSTTDAIIYN